MEVYDQEREDQNTGPEVWIRVVCRHCGAVLFHHAGSDLSVAHCSACYRDQSPEEETG